MYRGFENFPRPLTPGVWLIWCGDSRVEIDYRPPKTRLATAVRGSTLTYDDLRLRGNFGLLARMIICARPDIRGYIGHTAPWSKSLLSCHRGHPARNCDYWIAVRWLDFPRSRCRRGWRSQTSRFKSRMSPSRST